MTRVFVYGTLKRGHGNNRLLATARFVGRGRTVARFRMRATGFPLLLRDSGPGYRGDGFVTGEVYEVDGETLDRLDLLEGVSRGMYRRRTVIIDLGGARIKCQVYVANGNLFRGRSHRMTPIDGTYHWPQPETEKENDFVRVHDRP